MTALAETTPAPLPLVARMRQRLAEPLAAFAAIARNRALRRLELAWVGSIIGHWAFGIALGVYAYRIGGAAAVGLAGLIRVLPSILLAPFAASLGDRYSRVAVMITSDLVRAVLFTAGAACMMLDGPPGLVYVLAGLVMLAGSAFRPAQAAILPSLAETPEQLTAMNVVSSTIESVGFFVGPALGGILLAASSPQVVYIASALTCLWSAAMLVGMRADIPAEAHRGEAEAAGADGGRRSLRSFVGESFEGFRTIGRDARLRTLVLLFTAQTLVAGALNVFIVVLALRVFDSGPRGVGVLSAALGVGGLLGAAVAAALVGGKRLARGFAIGLMLWGAPLLFVGGVPVEVIALIAVAAIGLGNTMVDVAGFTLLQRAVPDEVLARVFGVLETVLVLGIGLGALLAPVVINAFGVRGALLAVGAFLPLLTVLTWAKLRKLDAGADVPEERLELLRSISLFRPLPPATTEFLASRLETREVAAGETVIRRGEAGDRFYVIAEGEFMVDVDDGADVKLGPGDFFGEIALLRDVPRTATVHSANGGGLLLSLTRDDFVPAVSGCSTSRSAADEVVAARLAGSGRPGLFGV